MQIYKKEGSLQAIIIQLISKLTAKVPHINQDPNT
jgi:hypothetical protein